ncbi:hypothetical protein SCANM124S_00646 [Streptomyces canus]
MSADRGLPHQITARLWVRDGIAESAEIRAG